MFFKKATLPLILVFVMGMAGFFIQYVPHWRADWLTGHVTKWFIIISGFGLFLGLYSLLHMHWSRIHRRVEGWGYSVFMFIGVVFTMGMGIWNGGFGPLTEGKIAVTDWYQWSFKYIQNPCQATIFSILAFFMASAAFRTFRARNVAAGLLLAAAVIAMFGRVPISELVAGKYLFPKAVDVLMDYPNLAAQRGIMLGLSLGGIAQSLRILFGIERSYLGAD